MNFIKWIKSGIYHIFWLLIIIAGIMWANYGKPANTTSVLQMKYSIDQLGFCYANESRVNVTNTPYTNVPCTPEVLLYINSDNK